MAFGFGVYACTFSVLARNGPQPGPKANLVSYINIARRD